jgi:hypothetical protein
MRLFTRSARAWLNSELDALVKALKSTDCRIFPYEPPYLLKQ